MALDVFLALLGFAFVSSGTPGPNNLMLLASGVNFGFKRTIPHMLGISTGFFILLMAVGLGLGALLVAFPSVHLILKVAGGAYLLYLAWKIGTARSMGKVDAASKPMTFLQAAAFQWVNPKAWAMAVAAMLAYTNPEHPYLSVSLVGLAFALVNLPTISFWTVSGVALRSWLSDPVRLKWFNITMGVLLALTLYPMLK